MNKLLFTMLAALLCSSIISLSADAPPRIIHEQVQAGVKGQPVYIRATVKDDTGPVKAVNLYCSTSSDSAPFKVKMRDSGASSYIGTIPENLVQNSTEISYYIEAMDSLEQTTETPWYTIRFKTVVGGTTANTPASPEQKSSWKKPLLIVGGTAAAVGIGVALSGGGGSDSSTPTTPVSSNGLFTGTATRIFSPEGGSSSAENYPITFNVLNNNTVTSDDIHFEGGHMDTTITDGKFNWSTEASAEGVTGLVLYSGTLVGDRIIGSIAAALVTSSGTNATYSGTFSASKQ